MDTDHKQEEVLEVARKFSTKMANSGYNQQARWEILNSALVKHYRDLAEWKTGGKPMYRNRQEMAARRKFKALEKTTWFWARRGGKDLTEQKDVPTAFRGKQRRDTEWDHSLHSVYTAE